MRHGGSICTLRQATRRNGACFTEQVKGSSFSVGLS